jgi:NADH dehydrogenase
MVQRLRGALAWWIWGIARIYFLIGVRTRLSVAINWLWIYMRNQRSARLITQGRIQLDRGGSQDDQGATRV